MTYNISDPKIQTENTTRAGVCDCLGSPGDKNVYFIPVTNVTTGSQASSSPVIMRCSKMQDFCVCDEDDICWRMINAYALIVINSFCDPICHMYARLTNSAPFTQALESDCGRRITLADELTPINNKTNTFKPLNSSADYYVKATSIRCLSAGQTCTPIKCTDTAVANPCGTSTTTTAPSTTTTAPSTTTTAPSTSTTTTAPSTTTTAESTTTTAPSTSTTTPSTTTITPSTTTTTPTSTTTPSTTTTTPSTTTTTPYTTTTTPSTTTTTPSTTTTTPSTTSTTASTTTTVPSTTTTVLTTTTTVLTTTTTPPLSRPLSFSSCISESNIRDCYNYACYDPSTISVVRIRCTDSTKFCVCTSDSKGCFTVSQSQPLYTADYLIYANASYTFLALNTGASQIKNSGTGKTYDFQTSMTFIPNDNTFLNAGYLAISCNGCNPIHNNGMDTQKPC
uniref:ShKT domain-containing protein n=1 Tax=Meloidogyne hapla TaxID=6305 RepID=A0A1I8BNU3_MELHA